MGREGTYPEYIRIQGTTKKVVLKGGYSGTSDERDPKIYTTVISQEGLSTSSVIVSFAPISVDGFTLIGGYSGIEFWDEAQITNNIITEASHFGIYGNVNGTPSGMISSNIISDSGSTGIFTGGLVTVQNNLVCNNFGHGLGCLGTSGLLTNIVLANNTTVNNGVAGVYSSSASLNAINNIVVGNNRGMHIKSDVTIQMSHNNVYGNTTDYIVTTPDSTDISVDPLFTDSTLRDYRLMPNSPCIDSGNSTNAPPRDLDDNPRPLDGNADTVSIADIGCYEYCRGFSSIHQAKSLPDGSFASITSAVSTACLPDRFYLENQDRCQGIGVLGSCQSTALGVTVEGIMTTMDGERLLSAYNVINGSECTPLKPWYMNVRSLGGISTALQNTVCVSRLLWDSPTDQWVTQPFVYGGASNSGLLVKVTGWVTLPNECSFFLSDSMPLQIDGGEMTGVYIDWPFSTEMPASGTYVEIVGISSCSTIRTQDGTDVVVAMIRPVSNDSVTSIALQ
ncbi:right-handed parallel beta-helix repeat-containing protein [bacterium]|nr:right-handed parallel beta-helix repeat-containing protein [bacterium]